MWGYSVTWRNFSTWEMWGKSVIICTIFDVLLTFMQFCCKISLLCNLRCFVAKSVMSRFTRFGMEKNWAKNYACGEKMTNMRYAQVQGYFSGTYLRCRGPKVTFSGSRRHDWPGQPIESSAGIQKVVIISRQSWKKWHREGKKIPPGQISLYNVAQSDVLFVAFGFLRPLR